MEQVTVTTERGIEKTTTLKNGDTLLEIAPIGLTAEELAASRQHYFINNEEVDHAAYLDRLRAPEL